MLAAERLHLLQIVVVGNDDASFTLHTSHKTNRVIIMMDIMRSVATNLNGLDQERGDFFAVGFESGFEVSHVVVSNLLPCFGASGSDAVQEGSEALSEEVGTLVGQPHRHAPKYLCLARAPALWICGHGDDADGATVEVVGAAEHDGFALGHLLDGVSPLASELDGGLQVGRFSRLKEKRERGGEMRTSTASAPARRKGRKCCVSPVPRATGLFD